jgi:hypothetical protein
LSEYQWVSIIALSAWLVMALSSYRAHQVGAGRTLVIALAWISIFFLVAAVFSAVAPEPSPWRP